MNSKEDGKILDDEMDQHAEIQWKTIQRLVYYLGDKTMLISYVAAEGALCYVFAYLYYVIHELARDKKN